MLLAVGMLPECLLGYYLELIDPTADARIARLTQTYFNCQILSKVLEREVLSILPLLIE